MLTRAKKKQKIAQEHLHILGTVFPLFAEFLSVNDITNLGMVCKDLGQTVNDLRHGHFFLVKEERLPTRISFEKRKTHPELGPDFELDDVTVSQVQPFTFFISQNSHPSRLVARFYLQKDLWEEIDNQKTQDLEAPPPTKMLLFVDDVESDDIMLSLNLMFGSSDFSASGIDNLREYGWSFERFQENGTEEHKEKLRGLLRIVYACIQRISSWPDSTIAYPSPQYLMRLFPESILPFFPEQFDLEADDPDQSSVPEFSYHPAPDMEAWYSLIPPSLFDGPLLFPVDSLPWYGTD